MDPRQRQRQHPHPHPHQHQHQPAPAAHPPTPRHDPNSSSFTPSNAAASYPRAPATSSPAPSHTPFAARAHSQGPAYAADHRRTSDTPYYPPAARSSLPELGHSRAQSASSLPSARELSRTMPPPPTSPPQPGPHQQQQQHHHQQHQQQSQALGYGPPPPRAPPVAVGPPTSFPSGRELPALSSIARSGSASASSMSISSMLGGPPPASRDSQPPPPHYPAHTAAPPPPVSGPGYAPPVHASPRMHSASSDYPPFRRPQTPDHQRPYDPRGSAVLSPHGHYSTPELQRYGTPQAGYHARHPSAPADTSREPGRTSAGPPPTAGNQMKPYGGMAPRPLDMARPEDAYARREEAGRPPAGMEYNPDRTGPRPYPYDDRYRPERERQAVPEPREREGRERAYSGGDAHRHMMSPHEMGQREPHPGQPQYGRPPDGRDQRDARDAQWARHVAESSYRAPMDHQRPPPEHPPSSASSASYPPHHAPAYQTAPPDNRYPPASQPPPHSQPASSAPPQPYDSPDRARMDHHLHQQQQQPHPLHRPRPGEEAPPPPSIAYNGGHGPSPFDPARNRTAEEPGAPTLHQRNLLAIQDISRKGRISPMPQAVQGAQPQQPGPAAEPGIKSEFGRMFSGIGSGVSAIGVSSPVPSGATAAYGGLASNPNLASARREEAENAVADSGPEATGKGGKGRRRKLKDDDSRPDDDSSGRLTPSSRANKRAKAHQHHHHQYVQGPSLGLTDLLAFSNQELSHHHHHHHHGAEGVPSPTVGTTPKNLKGGTPTASPTEKALPASHHHHHHHGARAGQPAQGPQSKQSAQSPTTVIPPKQKTTISSKSVLDAVADRPRHHLGDFIYDPGLRAGRLLPNTPTHRGFSSNPKPLPWDLIQDRENCILTVKVPLIHLSAVAREEITARAYLWGTDVYTDDSDVVAACIHGGWIKGEWAEDVDAAMLDWEDGKSRKAKNQAAEAVDLESEGLITSAPSSGPMSIPADRDLHVNVLILPRLVKYSATTRYGITSREFGGQFGGRHSVHDGISYMIQSIRWVENGAQPQARLRGKARRERMRKVMREVTASFGNMNGAEQQHQPDKEQPGIIRGEVMGNWRRKDTEQGPKETADKGEKEREPSEGDKENRLAHDKASEEAPKESKDVPDKDVEMADADAASKPAAEEEK